MIDLFFKVFEECDEETKKQRVRLFVLLFVALGFVSLVAMFIQVRKREDGSEEHR
jgi:hypothetical protein